MANPQVMLGFPREVSGLAVIRSLVRRGKRLAAYDSDAGSAGLHSGDVTDRYVWPDPAEEPSAFVDALLAAAPEHEKPVLVDLEGVALEAIMQRLDEVRESYRLLVPDPGVIEIAQDKARTAEFFSSNNLGAPRSLVIDSLHDLQQWTGGFPAVLKPRRGKGGRGQFKLSDDSAAIAAWEELAPGPGEYMIQEWIPGPVANLVTVGVLADASSEIMAQFSAQRLEVVQTPHIPEGPSAWVRSTYNEAWLDVAREFVSKSGWQGMAELEFKIDERDGALRILEINPRMWAWVDLPIRCGVDFPHLYCDLAEGKPVVPALTFPSDVHYLRIVLYSYTQFFRLFARRQGIAEFLRRLVAPFGVLLAPGKRLVLEDIGLRREYWHWFRFYLKNTDLS